MAMRKNRGIVGPDPPRPVDAVFIRNSCASRIRFRSHQNKLLAGAKLGVARRSKCRFLADLRLVDQLVRRTASSECGAPCGNGLRR